MEPVIKEQVTTLLGNYGWMFVAGMVMLLFRSTIENAVAGLMVFIGSDYDEDDVIELDGKPGRIVRVGLWKTVFFIYHIVDGNIVSGDKLVVQNDKLNDMKISKSQLKKLVVVLIFIYFEFIYGFYKLFIASVFDTIFLSFLIIFLITSA